MEASSDLSHQTYTLKVDFSWKKFKSLITEKDDPQSKPLYTVHYKATKPNLVFKTASDKSKFASGTLHTVSINADCEIHGQPIAIKALKRFKTEYTHLSMAFSNTDTPVPMTWMSTSGFKNWDFICLDPQQNPVAKFSANTLSMTNVGYIQFMQPKAAVSKEAIEEILVTGMTLFYCMILRTTSLLSFFGAVFSKPGHDNKNAPAVTSQPSVGSNGTRTTAETLPGDENPFTSNLMK